MEPTPKNLHKDIRICAFCSATIDENRASATAVELDIISAPMSLKMTDVAVMSNRLTVLI
jgi:hypothetical protein